MQREPNTEYILSLSYGKDSLACLEAIKLLGYPLDRIVHAEVWATDDIPADLPVMIEFKKYADDLIYEKYGIRVEHIYSIKDGEKQTYEKCFYSKITTGKNKGRIYGFPFTIGSWCNDRLKLSVLEFVGAKGERVIRRDDGKRVKTVQYLGIAPDEPERIKRQNNKRGVVLPLVDIGWDEEKCYEWCKENNLLSPIYYTAPRGGCWFCHYQGVDQLRILRKEHPELWQLLLKWDDDSPTTFKSDGFTVHDFEKRFQYEDRGLLIPGDKKFRWKHLRKIEEKEKEIENTES